MKRQEEAEIRRQQEEEDLKRQQQIEQEKIRQEQEQKEYDEYDYYDQGICPPGELRAQQISKPSRCNRLAKAGDELSMHYTGKVFGCTVPGHKSWTAGCFLKQNYPKYRLCEREMGGSYLL